MTAQSTNSGASLPQGRTGGQGALLWLTAAWTAGGTILYLIWPGAAPVLLPLCLILPLAWYWLTRGKLEVFDIAPASFVLLIAACYALVNAGWSLARAEAYGFTAMLFVIVFCLHFATGAFARIRTSSAIHAMGIGFYCGFVVSGLFLCFEILSRFAVYSRLISAFPQLWPQAQRHVAGGGELPNYFLNHRMAALAILLWPAFLTAARLSTGGVRQGLLLLGLLPSILAVAAGEHATSQVAMLVGGVVCAVSHVAPRASARMLMGAWIVACIAVVPLCLAAYAANVYRSDWLAPSAKDRLIIWKATSDLIPNAPILGVGIHSGRTISRTEFDPPTAPGTPFKLSVGWHSHNAFLQVWFEAGAIGAIILTCWGLLVLLSIRRERGLVRSARFATFASCTMIAATGFSAFAPWLVASFALAAVFMVLAAAQATAASDLSGGVGTADGPTLR